MEIEKLDTDIYIYVDASTSMILYLLLVISGDHLVASRYRERCNELPPVPEEFQSHEWIQQTHPIEGSSDSRWRYDQN